MKWGNVARALAAHARIGNRRASGAVSSRFIAAQASAAIRARMLRAFLNALAALALAALAFAALPALAQGEIGTLERGAYVCELPGDATGRAGVEQPEANFAITSASRYTSPQGSGTYLRRGNVLEMTSGPRNGERYQVISSKFLRKLENGDPGRLRCVRQGG